MLEELNEPVPEEKKEILDDESEGRQMKRVHFAQFDDRYRFSASIPQGWKIEYVPEIEAVNIYQPNTIDGPREQSQIFIILFKANS